jgi:site-specific recombinase XerD
MTKNTELMPLKPDKALDKYLTHRENNDVSDKTLESHRYRLQHFIRWCKQEDIETLDQLSIRNLQDYKHWRKNDGDLNNVSWHTQMVTFRVFIQWAENYQAVTPRLSDRLEIPHIEPDEDARDTVFEKGRANDILEYLGQLHYASRRHALFKLMWHTGIRVGTVRGLDLKDYNRSERYIEITHRPAEDTALKNKTKGERPITLAQPEANVLNDYIDKVRIETTDQFGRDPLFTTKNGRPHRGTIRQWIYKLSRPCTYNGGNCPHGREMDDCEAMTVQKASKCPSSFSPHTIRRSSITKWLSEDVPPEAVSDRMNVNDEALEKHYDKRTEKGKMEQRKGYFE